MIPHTARGVWPAGIHPSRFAARIRTDSPEGCSIAMLGLADDTGVLLNNGRPGARDGPQAFRAALARYGIAEPDGLSWPGVFDAGDVLPATGISDPAESLHETHSRVTEAAAALLDRAMFPIAIGGGHDLTYPFVRAVARRFGRLAGVYFDAHLDVRDQPGSGMPFRALIEHCHVRPLIAMGINPLVNSRAHMRWLRERGGRILSGHPAPHEAGGEVLSLPRDFFASCDLDVIDQSFAPGVSAPNPAGWSPTLAEQWCYAVARRPNIRCFDIMELNPLVDDSGRTARLAAHLFLAFLLGFASRD